MIEYFIQYVYTLKETVAVKALRSDSNEDQDKAPRIITDALIIDLNPHQDLKHQALIAARMDFEEKHSAALIWYVDMFEIQTVKKQ